MNFLEKKRISTFLIMAGLYLPLMTSAAPTNAASTKNTSTMAARSSQAANTEINGSKYPPGSFEAIAFARAKDFPKPEVILPPLDLKTASREDKLKYSRAVCPIYVKAYEELYLKQFHIIRAYSPFSGFCEKRSVKLGNDDGSSLISTPEAFKKRLDRVSLGFEMSGGLANAQDRIAKDAQLEKLTTQIEELTKTTEALHNQINGFTTKQTQIESRMQSQKENSREGFLAMAGLNPGTETKIVECLLLISLGLAGFLIFQNSRY